jgi:hypothetical protein
MTECQRTAASDGQYDTALYAYVYLLPAAVLPRPASVNRTVARDDHHHHHLLRPTCRNTAAACSRRRRHGSYGCVYARMHGVGRPHGAAPGWHRARRSYKPIQHRGDHHHRHHQHHNNSSTSVSSSPAHRWRHAASGTARRCKSTPTLYLTWCCDLQVPSALSILIHLQPPTSTTAATAAAAAARCRRRPADRRRHTASGTARRCKSTPTLYLTWCCDSQVPSALSILILLQPPTSTTAASAAARCRRRPADRRRPHGVRHRTVVCQVVHTVPVTVLLLVGTVCTPNIHTPLHVSASAASLPLLLRRPAERQRRAAAARIVRRRIRTSSLYWRRRWCC